MCIYNNNLFCLKKYFKTFIEIKKRHMIKQKTGKCKIKVKKKKLTRQLLNFSLVWSHACLHTKELSFSTIFTWKALRPLYGFHINGMQLLNWLYFLACTHDYEILIHPKVLRLFLLSSM